MSTRVFRRMPPLLLLAAIMATTSVPILALVVRALGTTWRYPDLWPTALDLRALNDVLVMPRFRGALRNSVGLAIATSVVSVVLGFTAARTLARSTGWPRRLGMMAAFLPVVAPPIALGIGLQVAALTVGLGGHVLGVFCAHLVPATGYVTLYFVGVLTAYDDGIEEAARTLGASPRQVWWHVTAPTWRARWFDALWLAGLVSWGQLALSLMVGGGAVRTLPIELLALLRAGDDRAGAAASLVLAIVPVCGLLLTRLRWRGAGASP